MKANACAKFCAVVVALLAGSVRSEVVDVDGDGVVGPHEAVEVARLWQQAAASVIPATAAWSLSGNAGTTAGTDFLGTTDDEPLELRVGGYRALRIEPNDTSPNLIGGSLYNFAEEDVVGAFIGGGGKGGSMNGVNDDFGTVGGGALNFAGKWSDSTDIQTHATVCGGSANRAYGKYATVCGGQHNLAEGYSSHVCGGALNTASGEHSIVGGGRENTAAGRWSAVCGGRANSATGDYSFAAGNHAQVQHSGSFVWSDPSGGAFGSSGINQFLIRAAGGVGMGTNAPATQLHVARNISGGAGIQNHVAAIENTSTGASPDILALKLNITTPTDANNYITFMNSAGNIGSIEGNGSGGVTLSTTGGDFAEYLPVRGSENELPEAGDLVGLLGGAVCLNTDGASRVFVVSTAPAVLGNRPEEGNMSREVPIAFVGQVPVRVRGPVQAGDWIIPSGQNDGTGVAIRFGDITINQITSIAGCALEGSASAEEKLVKVLVGVPQDRAWRELLRQNEARMVILEEQMKAMRGEVNLLKEQMAEAIQTKTLPLVSAQER
jgi:hypothetical protein